MNIHRTLIRFVPAMAIALGFALAVPATSHADEGPWTVQQVAGSARTMPVDGRAAALRIGDRLSVGDEIETGADGRLVLVRGEASITVSPSSRMSLNAKPENGLTTKIVQKLGTLLFKVNRKPKQHFEVSTPYLAAVVKGTTFTVSVDTDGAAVHVVEGLVQVADLDTRQDALVRPGQTATTSSTPGGGLSVARGNAPAATPGKRSAVGQDDSAPGRIKKVDAGKSGKGPANGKANGIVINRDLANTAIDIPAVTNGLAGSVGTSVHGNATSANIKGKANGVGKGNAGFAVQSTPLGGGIASGVSRGPGRGNGNSGNVANFGNSGNGNSSNVAKSGNSGNGNGNGNGKGKGKGKGKGN